MKRFFETIQPAVKTETKKVAISTVLGVVLMWGVFWVLHLVMPEKVPLDYRVFLGALVGGSIAVLNFFLMGITVQKVVAAKDEESARMQMKASYSRRMMIQMLWVIVAIVAPCFQFVAGIVPLLFPSIGIKILGILSNRKQK